MHQSSFQNVSLFSLIYTSSSIKDDLPDDYYLFLGIQSVPLELQNLVIKINSLTQLRRTFMILQLNKHISLTDNMIYSEVVSTGSTVECL